MLYEVEEMTCAAGYMMSPTGLRLFIVADDVKELRTLFCSGEYREWHITPRATMTIEDARRYLKTRNAAP